MEKDIQIFENNAYIKSDALFDEVFGKIQRETNWFDDVFHEYRHAHNLETIQTIHGVSIDGRDFVDLMVMVAYVEKITDEQAFKARSLKLIDAFFNYETQETYEAKVLEELNILYDFEASSLNTIHNLDTTKASDLEYAIAMGRLGQPYGTKRNEFRSLLERNMNIADFEQYDRVTLVAENLGTNIRNDLSKFKIDLEKYPYASTIMGEGVATFDNSTFEGRVFNLQSKNILNRGIYKDKVVLDIDTNDYYKYVKLIDKQASGKTDKREDNKISSYLFNTSVYVESILPQGHNEGQLSYKKLGYRWYDLVYINGKCLKDIVELPEGASPSYECLKKFMQVSSDGKSVINFVKLNNKGDNVKAQVLPVEITHNVERYKETFTWWDKVLNFFGFNIIKDIEAPSRAPQKDYSKEILLNINDKLVEHGLRPDKETNPINIDVNEINNEILAQRFNSYINKDREIDKDLENTK